MGIILYTAPDCLRCKIVKAFLHEKGLSYEAVDFKEQKDTFATFYRANRPKIYRNPEGVEFPLFDDGNCIKQGSGEIIAYLLAGHELEGSVTRSDLLHGWISGLYPSLCPSEHEEHYRELVRHLADGGLRVHIQADGRKPELLKNLIGNGHVSRLTLTILGPASVYNDFFCGPVATEELAKTIELVNPHSPAGKRGSSSAPCRVPKAHRG
jgi:pyruvate formate lyase activating enzyme